MDYGNTKITQHALQVSEFIMLKVDNIQWIMETPKLPSMHYRCQSLHNVEVGRYSMDYGNT